MWHKNQLKPNMKNIKIVMIEIKICVKFSFIMSTNGTNIIIYCYLS
jgi:hypothetical protein